MRSLFEEKYLELKRRGDQEKANWIENIEKHVRPSYIDRILIEDKKVMQELVLPKWVSWELLHSWASEVKKKGEKIIDLCVLCGKRDNLGVYFNEKFICEQCFIGLKNYK